MKTYGHGQCEYIRKNCECSTFSRNPGDSQQTSASVDESQVTLKPTRGQWMGQAARDPECPCSSGASPLAVCCGPAESMASRLVMAWCLQSLSVYLEMQIQVLDSLGLYYSPSAFLWNLALCLPQERMESSW